MKNVNLSIFGMAMRLLVLALLISSSAVGQQPVFEHVEPPSWWIGMKHNTVEILFHDQDQDLTALEVSLEYPGVSLKESKTVENPHYRFLTLEIDPGAQPGNVPIRFGKGRKSFVHDYPLEKKSTAGNRIQGFNSSDVIYLIMPDRFANGDVSNDSVPGMFEGVHRSRGGARHGGDLKGITDHLEYIHDLGVTAIWLNPVLENNQRRSSYHGYAITDLYNVDRRFGGNKAYLAFIDKSHAMGLKVIQDMVINHIGNDHWLMHDPPAQDWVHRFPEFTRSNYQLNVLSDPYRSEFDLIKMNDGWFDTTMPDVNQTNPFVAQYLIQNTLWWIEYAGIDGIRMDTHPYPDKNFMSRWSDEVLDEYPAFNIVGEVWIDDPATTAYWQKGMVNKDGYQSNLPSVTDFPFCFAVPRALNEGASWNTGMRRLYMLLSQDFIYPDPFNNVIFLDNHDMTRFFLSVKRDLRKFKMGLVFLLTMRGIPEIYYGTEILMDGDGAHHPDIRRDFPGGWPGDEVNSFTNEGRSEEQREAFNFLKRLLQWRKDQAVVHSGKLTHYIPEDNIYVYFRHNEEKVLMVVLNGNDEEKTVTMERFAENVKGASTATDIMTGREQPLDHLTVGPWTALVLELH